MKKKHRECRERERERRTDFDGRDAEATGLEDDADAAGGDALAEAADHTSGDQDVLHGSLRLHAKCSCKCLSGKSPRNRAVYIKSGVDVMWPRSVSEV